MNCLSHVLSQHGSVAHSQHVRVAAATTGPVRLGTAPSAPCRRHRSTAQLDCPATAASSWTTDETSQVLLHSPEPTQQGAPTAGQQADAALTTPRHSPPPQQQHQPPEPAPPRSPSPQAGEEQLDEKELARRAKISAANSGRRPWNAGKRHTPETIAKIRERTREAMSRPDVVSAYREGVSKHLQKKALERQMNPPPPKAPKPPAVPKERPPRKPRRTPSVAATGEVGGEALHTPGAPTPAAAAPRARRKSATAPAAATASQALPPAVDTAAGTAPGEAPVLPQKRTRKPATEAHRAAIAAAIRAKWADPEYRSRAISGMQQHLKDKTGKEPGTSRPQKRRSGSKDAGAAASQSKASSPGSGEKKPRKTSSSTSRGKLTAAQRKLAGARLAQIQTAVHEVVRMRRLLSRMEVNMEGTRVKMAAFANDPRMASRAHDMMTSAVECLAVARGKLAQLEAAIPAGVTYNAAGVIHVTDPTVLVPTGPAPAAAGAPRVPGDAPAVTVPTAGSAAQQGVEQPEEVPPIDSLSVLTPVAHANGHNHNHDLDGQLPALANGHANGAMNGHANGHSHVNGRHHESLDAPSAPLLSAAVSAAELLQGGGRGAAEAQAESERKSTGVAISSSHSWPRSHPLDITASDARTRRRVVRSRTPTARAAEVPVEQAGQGPPSASTGAGREQEDAGLVRSTRAGRARSRSVHVLAQAAGSAGFQHE